MYHRSCDYNHPCTKICYMDCGECPVLMTKDLPCGHLSTLPCYVDIDTYQCEEMVGVLVLHFLHCLIYYFN